MSSVLTIIKKRLENSQLFSWYTVLIGMLKRQGIKTSKQKELKSNSLTTFRFFSTYLVLLLYEWKRWHVSHWLNLRCQQISLKPLK